MRIEIEIPKEFEEHFKQDKFEDTLHRLSADAHLVAGNYERETAIMLIKAFADSKPAYDVEKVVEQLEEETDCPNCSMYCADAHICGFDEMRKQAIDIVKRGGAE